MLKIQVIGYLGNDCALKDVSGKQVINFSVAHTEKYTDSMQVKREKTTWVNCSLWEKPNIAPYLKKGTLVWLEGFPETDSYVDSQGEVITTLKTNVFQIQLLSSSQQ